LSSGTAIVKAAQNELRGGAKSVLHGMAGGDLRNIAAEMVADAARQHAPLVREVFDEAMEYLGIGIAGLINLFSPEAVVIGGRGPSGRSSFWENPRHDRGKVVEQDLVRRL
jgi:predicted NBD/HSP70 family sugar kinase